MIQEEDGYDSIGISRLEERKRKVRVSEYFVLDYVNDHMHTLIPQQMLRNKEVQQVTAERNTPEEERVILSLRYNKKMEAQKCNSKAQQET